MLYCFEQRMPISTLARVCRMFQNIVHSDCMFEQVCDFLNSDKLYFNRENHISHIKHVDSAFRLYYMPVCDNRRRCIPCGTHVPHFLGRNPNYFDIFNACGPTMYCKLDERYQLQENFEKDYGPCIFKRNSIFLRDYVPRGFLWHWLINCTGERMPTKAIGCIAKRADFYASVHIIALSDDPRKIVWLVQHIISPELRTSEILWELVHTILYLEENFFRFSTTHAWRKVVAIAEYWYDTLGRELCNSTEALPSFVHAFAVPIFARMSDVFFEKFIEHFDYNAWCKQRGRKLSSIFTTGGLPNSDTQMRLFRRVFVFETHLSKNFYIAQCCHIKDTSTLAKAAEQTLAHSAWNESQIKILCATCARSGNADALLCVVQAHARKHMPADFRKQYIAMVDAIWRRNTEVLHLLVQLDGWQHHWTAITEKLHGSAKRSKS